MPSSRYLLENSEEKLQIILPSRKNWLFLIASGLWFALWLIIGIPAISAAVLLFTIYFPSVFLDSQDVSAFGQGIVAGGYVLLLFLIWASLWIASGIYIFFDFFHQLVGYEIMDISEKSITLTKKTLHIHRGKEYSAGLICDLRIVPYSLRSGRSPKSELAHATCTIAFDYKNKTYLFGIGSSFIDTRQILSEIERRFPQYQKAS